MTKVELAHHPIMIGTPTHAPSSAGSQRAGGTRSSPTPIRRATRWTNGGRTNYAEIRDIWFARGRARLLSSIFIHRFEATRGIVAGVVHFYATLVRDSTVLLIES